MFRKSVRHASRTQPKCANCNLPCVNERTFASALPQWFDGFSKSKQEELEGYHWTSQNLDEEIDRKPERETDGSLRRESVAMDDCDEFSSIASSVSILDALLKIFHFHWKCQKRLLMSTKNEKENLIICSDCAHSLSKMYDGYDSFTKSTLTSKGKSYLSSVVFPFEDESETRRSKNKRNADKEWNQKLDSTLRRIKTTFTGDLKKLSSCRVKLPKLTLEDAAEVAEANESFFSVPEPSEYFKVNKKEEPLISDDDEDRDYILSMVNVESDTDVEVSRSFRVNSYQKESIVADCRIRKRGRPRTRPLSLSNLEKKTKVKSENASKETDCDQCGKKLRTNVLLKQHKRIYHQEHYDCSYCDERHSGPKQLKDHLNLYHEDEKREQCTVCLKNFFTRLELKKHGIVHLDRKKVLCSICNGTFPSERHLKAHQLTHTVGEGKLPVHLCPIEGCNKRYTRAQFLHNHIRYLHERRKDFACTYPGCEKSFGTESYLNAHIVSHESSGSHLCELCGKNYKHKKDLRIHERRNHSEVKNRDELKQFLCEVCPKRYFRADHLRTHRVKANHYIGGQEPTLPDASLLDVVTSDEYKCSVCNRVFASDMAVKTHELTHVDNEDAAEARKYSCSACDQKYTSLKTLEYHNKYMHQLKGAYACSFCPKSFGRVSSFKRHMTVHSSTQHICGECNKSYKNKVNLMHHYRKEHILTEKNYEHECGCGKRFYRRDMLRTHVVKTGHVAAKRHDKIKAAPVHDKVKRKNVSVYVMESGDSEEEEEAEMEEEEEDEGQDEQIPEGDEELPEAGEVDENVPMEEMVEITGEDAEGAIAHVMLVDSQGMPQRLGTDVIAVMAQDGDLDSNSIAMYNYSIHLE